MSMPEIGSARNFYSKYTLDEKELGHGLSCVVKLCHEKATGVFRALKLIDLQHVSEQQEISKEEFLQATMNEVKMLRLCAGHPNIIRMYDYFGYSTHIFMIFEFCPNGELFDYLNEKISFSQKEVRIFMEQLCSAVRYIHSLNICHRDLKPENILLDKKFNLKVSDFGFAVQLDEGQKLRELYGTPSYLAPETLRASMYEDAPGYGMEIDLWACGVIMYTLLVGFPPFWHRSQVRMIRMIMEATYSFDFPEWTDVQPEAKDLIQKLLTLDVSKRISAENIFNHPYLAFSSLRFESESSHIASQEGDAMELEFSEQITLSVKPKWHLKAVVYALIWIQRLIRLHGGKHTSGMAEKSLDPYKCRSLRRIIDNSAFHVYGHWLKRHDVQTRASMFQMMSKVEVALQVLKEQTDSETLASPIVATCLDAKCPEVHRKRKGSIDSSVLQCYVASQPHSRTHDDTF